MVLSVVVLNWNGRHHLDTCLRALKDQTRHADEVIVVDNHSTRDDSVEYLRVSHPWVKVVVLPENRGFAGGNHAALPFARGEVILLNNDTKPEPTWLEELERCAIQHPKVGIVASHLVNWEGTLTDSAGDGCKVTGRGYARNRGRFAREAPESGPVFGACAGAALYRRCMIEEVGFLDNDFFMNFEDTDLALRARLRGWTAWFCREAVVRHRVSASQGNWSDLNVYYGARNHLWVCMKNLPARLLIKWSPLIGAEVFAMFIASWRRGRAYAYLSGLRDGIRGLSNMWSKRREIQAERRILVNEFESLLHRPRASWTTFRRACGSGEERG